MNDEVAYVLMPEGGVSPEIMELINNLAKARLGDNPVVNLVEHEKVEETLKDVLQAELGR